MDFFFNRIQRWMYFWLEHAAQQDRFAAPPHHVHTPELLSPYFSNQYLIDVWLLPNSAAIWR